MLKITFLGTSGSSPTTKRSMPSIALQYNGYSMLWDVGECTQRQMMKYDVGYGSIDAIFITHAHLDHYLGLFGLLETLNLNRTKKKMDVFGFDDFSWIEQRYAFVKFHKIKKGRIYSGKNYSVSAFPVKHCKGAYGLVFQEEDQVKFYEKKAHELGLWGKLFSEIQKIGWVKIKGKKINLEDVTWKKKGRKIVYTGDTLPCDAVADAARDADVLIHEATFDPERKGEAKERLHSTMEDAVKIAKKAKAKQLVLTHFSPRYPEVELFGKEIRKIFRNTVFASDGLVLDVKF